MKIEYHLSTIESYEQDEVKDFLEQHISTLHFVEGRCQAHKESDVNLLKIICAVSKTHEPTGHCKYSTSLHLYLPIHNTQHVHVIKKEGHGLITTLHSTLEALRHHLEHVIDKLKEKRA